MNNDYKPLNLYTRFADSAKEFPNSSIYFDEILLAFPELGLETTYKEATAAIVHRANQLHELGIKKGDKVVIYKSAKFDTYLLAVAVSYLGAVPAMISYHLPAETMDVLSKRLDFPFFIYDEATAGRCQQMKNLTSEKMISLDKLLAVQPTTECSQELLDPSEISYLTHTSGTTGIPKLIAHSANSMGWRIKLQREVMNWMDDKNGLLSFHISPVHSRYNIGVSSLMTFGHPFMPIANISKANIEKVMESHPPYAFETHPNNFVQLAVWGKKNPELFSSIKYLHSTFDAINKDTMETFLKCSKYERPVFLQIYGQSECGPMIIKKHTRESIKDLNAREMGVGMPGLSAARIADENGNELPAGTKGNIHFHSKGRALTYFKEDQRFQDCVYGEWWDTGDYGVMNEEGVLFLYDRQVDLIENVESNLAIEDALLDRHDFLDEVVIVRDKDGKPQPIISVAEGYEMDWDAWYKSISEMPYLNKPMVMKFEDIPRTATMKVQRLQMERDFKAQA